PAGTFMMGEGMRDEVQYQQHCLDYGYWLAVYPVTFGHFQTFMDEDGYLSQKWWREANAAGYWTSKGYRDFYNAPGSSGEANEPVRGVSWYEGLAFCRWLNARWEKQLPAGFQLRLPTIAEWEKGARGGLEIPYRPAIGTISTIADFNHVIALDPNPIPRRSYPWGNEITLQHANIEKSGIEMISAVGLFSRGRTPYGCLDMIGNVYEWTTTRYNRGVRYAVDGRDLLARESEDTTILMGGGYYDASVEHFIKSGGRDGGSPDADLGRYGFRIVLSPFAL
ncbi:MAG: SUMF1/EgtB/PvdO family nonheme iron enzyme, partial [Chloroflexota bacterium]